MRSIVNISLTPEQKAFVEKCVKKDGYSSTSEFFRMLIRQFKLHQETINAVIEGERDIKEGRVYTLDSLRDVLD